LNYFVQQVKPDGLTVAAGDSPQIDPIRYRAPQSRYDPTRFEFVGGIGRGGSMIIMDAAAEKRLADRSAPPVTIGAASSVPRSGQAIAAWGIGFLGWNAKWSLVIAAPAAFHALFRFGGVSETPENPYNMGSWAPSGSEGFGPVFLKVFEWKGPGHGETVLRASRAASGDRMVLVRGRPPGTRPRTRHARARTFPD